MYDDIEDKMIIIRTIEFLCVKTIYEMENLCTDTEYLKY